ncbi:ATP-binding protein [Streptomyces sp. LP05-1]|uniref:ATP-binding protein n=1 Tax=Streptomyces pyxinae TaxID=2970734 RepID=A0ABT2CHG8_9ACTN|nr:ATP-binding protein [Streptomyces sp. LP05-1]MCS0636750.1 ATP-binding protein [Streptomyces sp. LP05-1]
MATEPLRNGDVGPGALDNLALRFDGDLGDVTRARLAALDLLGALARADPPRAAEHLDDVVLVVAELAANAVQYAPGPFVLRLRRTYDGVHVSLRDSSPRPPAPRPFNPASGTGGIGWHLIHALADQVSVVPDGEGKDVHVFLPW